MLDFRKFHCGLRGGLGWFSGFSACFPLFPGSSGVWLTRISMSPNKPPQCPLPSLLRPWASWLAAGNGQTDVVKLLLERGADPNMTDGWNNTPLHNAVQMWDIDSVEILLEKGADLNIRDQNGNTPLAVILHEGDGANEEIVLARMLLEAGAEPDMTDKEKLEGLSSKIEALQKEFNSSLDCFSRYKWHSYRPNSKFVYAY